MPLTHLTLDQLAVPVNRGDFLAFVAAVEQLPAADRDILAVLGGQPRSVTAVIGSI